MSDLAVPLSGGVSIRAMGERDLAQVVAIDHASFTLPWPANSYRFELYENPTSLLYVAEASHTSAVPAAEAASADGGSAPAARVVGMIVVWVILDEAHVATIAMHPDYRGRGIAQALLATALAESIRRGVHSATLEVRQNNLPAQKLYRRFHFEVVGRRPRYYHDNHEDALIMTASGLDQSYLAWLENGGWKHSPPAPLTGERYDT